MPSLYKNAVIQGDKGRAIPVCIPTPPPLQPTEQGQAEKAYFAERLLVAREEDQRQLEALLAIRHEELAALMEAEGRRVYQEAAQSGYEAGQAVAQTEAKRLMAEIGQCYQQLEIDRKAFVESCRQEISQLVLRVTEHVLRQELTTSGAALPSLVASAIGELVVRRQVCVFVHPSRVAAVSDDFTQWPVPLDGQALLVRGDPTLDMASFRAEDDLGAVVVDLPQLLAKLKLALV